MRRRCIFGFYSLGLLLGGCREFNVRTQKFGKPSSCGEVNLEVCVTWGSHRSPKEPQDPSAHAALALRVSKKKKKNPRIISGSAPTSRLSKSTTPSKDFIISFANPRSITRILPVSTDNDSRWVTHTESERAPAYVQRRNHCLDIELTKFQYAFSRNFRQKGMIALNTYLRQYQCVKMRR
jgi:hypothetical protein